MDAAQQARIDNLKRNMQALLTRGGGDVGPSNVSALDLSLDELVAASLKPLVESHLDAGVADGVLSDDLKPSLRVLGRGPQPTAAYASSSSLSPSTTAGASVPAGHAAAVGSQNWASSRARPINAPSQPQQSQAHHGAFLQHQEVSNQRTRSRDAVYLTRSAAAIVGAASVTTAANPPVSDFSRGSINAAVVTEVSTSSSMQADEAVSRAVRAHHAVAASSDVSRLRADVATALLQLTEQKQAFISIVGELEVQLGAAQRGKEEAEAAAARERERGDRSSRVARQLESSTTATLAALDQLREAHTGLQAQQQSLLRSLSTAQHERESIRAELAALKKQCDEYRLAAESGRGREALAAATEESLRQQLQSLGRDLQLAKDQAAAQIRQAEAQAETRLGAAEKKREAAVAENRRLNALLRNREESLVQMSGLWERCLTELDKAREGEVSARQASDAALRLADQERVGKQAAAEECSALRETIVTLQREVMRVKQEYSSQIAAVAERAGALMRSEVAHNLFAMSTMGNIEGTAASSSSSMAVPAGASRVAVPHTELALKDLAMPAALSSPTVLAPRHHDHVAHPTPSQPPSVHGIQPSISPVTVPHRQHDNYHNTGITAQRSAAARSASPLPSLDHADAEVDADGPDDVDAYAGGAGDEDEGDAASAVPAPVFATPAHVRQGDYDHTRTVLRPAASHASSGAAVGASRQLELGVLRVDSPNSAVASDGSPTQQGPTVGGNGLPQTSLSPREPSEPRNGRGVRFECGERSDGQPDERGGSISGSSTGDVQQQHLASSYLHLTHQRPPEQQSRPEPLFTAASTARTPAHSSSPAPAPQQPGPARSSGSDSRGPLRRPVPVPVLRGPSHPNTTGSKGNAGGSDGGMSLRLPDLDAEGAGDGPGTNSSRKGGDDLAAVLGGSHIQARRASRMPGDAPPGSSSMTPQQQQQPQRPLEPAGTDDDGGLLLPALASMPLLAGARRQQQARDSQPSESAALSRSPVPADEPVPPPPPPAAASSSSVIAHRDVEQQTHQPQVPLPLPQPALERRGSAGRRGSSSRSSPSPIPPQGTQADYSSGTFDVASIAHSAAVALAPQPPQARPFVRRHSLAPPDQQQQLQQSHVGQQQHAVPRHALPLTSNDGYLPASHRPLPGRLELMPTPTPAPAAAVAPLRQAQPQRGESGPARSTRVPLPMEHNDHRGAASAPTSGGPVHSLAPSAPGMQRPQDATSSSSAPRVADPSPAPSPIRPPPGVDRHRRDSAHNGDGNGLRPHEVANALDASAFYTLSPPSAAKPFPARHLPSSSASVQHPSAATSSDAQVVSSHPSGNNLAETPALPSRLQQEQLLPAMSAPMHQQTRTGDEEAVGDGDAGHIGLPDHAFNDEDRLDVPTSPVSPPAPRQMHMMRVPPHHHHHQQQLQLELEQPPGKQLPLGSLHASVPAAATVALPTTGLSLTSTAAEVGDSAPHHGRQKRVEQVQIPAATTTSTWSGLVGTIGDSIINLVSPQRPTFGRAAGGSGGGFAGASTTNGGHGFSLSLAVLGAAGAEVETSFTQALVEGATTAWATLTTAAEDEEVDLQGDDDDYDYDGGGGGDGNGSSDGHRLTSNMMHLNGRWEAAGLPAASASVAADLRVGHATPRYTV